VQRSIEVRYNLSFDFKSFRSVAAREQRLRMPIYEYRCASCGHELEALQKLSDAPLTLCPACHKAELRKRVSAAGFQLKGSGWYVTDFRNSGAKSATKEKPATDEAKTGNGASAAAAGGSDTKTDAPKSDTKTADKPAATSESKTPASTSTTKSDT
jgi:putative FmdB family regulatory protein